MSSEESDDEPLAVLAAAKQLDPKKFSRKAVEIDDDYEPNHKPKRKKAKKRKTVFRKQALTIHYVAKQPSVVQRPDDVWLYLKDFNPAGPYSCLLCPEWFISKAKAIIHYVLNHKKDYCGICRYFVTDRQAWEAHQRFHVPWPCSQCTESFMTEFELRYHLSTAHSLVHCRMCHFRVPDNEQYHSHLTKKHNVKNIIHKDEEILWQINQDGQGFYCLLCSKSNILPTTFFGHYLGFHHFTIKCITNILAGKDTPFSMFGADLSQQFIEGLKDQGKCGYVDLDSKPPEEPVYNIKREDVYKGLLVDVKEEVLSDTEDTKKDYVMKEDYDILKTYKGDEDFDVTQMELLVLDKNYFEYLDDIFNCINSANFAPIISSIQYDKEKPNTDVKIHCDLCKTNHHAVDAFATHVCKTHNVKTVPKFSCRLCVTTFDTLNELEHHMTEELGEFEDLWLCQFCDKEFDNRASTRAHLNTEHQNDLDFDNCFSPHLGFKCRYCPTLFWNEPDREEHQIKSHFEKYKDNFYRCECTEVFSDKIWFTYHYFKQHEAVISSNSSTTHLFKCCLCAIVLPSVNDIRSHFESQHPEARKLFCSLEGCQYRPLSHKKSFQLHVRRLHAETSQNRSGGRKDQTFPCAVCGREFSTNRACSAHTAQAHGPGKFKCRLCKVLLHSVDERKLHYLLHHPGVHPFVCTDCGKSFLYKSSLYMHKREHSADKQDYTCNICQKVFAKKDSFREHQMIHEGPRHACSYCPMRFVQRSNMLRHERRHTGERPYQCQHCDRTFSDKGACNSHSRVHTKAPTFDCLYCGQTFAQKSKLTYHIRRHTGENLETCTICSKLFTSMSSLREHMKTHEAKKAGDIKCPLCDRTYIDERYMLRHLRTSHAAGRYPCPLCSKLLSCPAGLRAHVLTHSKKHMFWCKICPNSYNARRSMVRHLRHRHGLKGSEINVKDFYKRLDPRECKLAIDEATMVNIFGEAKRNENDILIGDFVSFPDRFNPPQKAGSSNEKSREDDENDEEDDEGNEDNESGENGNGDETEGNDGEQELEPTDFVSVKIEPVDEAYNE